MADLVVDLVALDDFGNRPDRSTTVTPTTVTTATVTTTATR